MKLPKPVRCDAAAVGGVLAVRCANVVLPVELQFLRGASENGLSFVNHVIQTYACDLNSMILVRAARDSIASRDSIGGSAPSPGPTRPELLASS